MIKFFKLLIEGKYILFLTIGMQQATYWLKIPSYNNISGIAYKDAANWELCSQGISIFGVLPTNISDWCLRRPINIEFISVLLKVFQTFSNVYFVLGVIFSIILIWSYSQCRKILSLTPSIILLAFVLGFWFVFCNNMVLSESVALILGTLGLGLIAKIFFKPKLVDILLLSIVFTLIQIIRPGNLMSPFLLVLLSPLFAPTFKIRLAISTFLFLIPIIFPLFIKAFTQLFYYQNYLTGGNAWSSIYGLINNNITWQEAYSRVPKDVGSSEILINQYLKNQSIQDFVDNPLNLVISIWQNLSYMLGSVFPFYPPINVVIPNYLSIFILFLNLLAVVYVLKNIYDKKTQYPTKIFVFLFLFSTFIFYSITWKSEPSRSLSATLPISIFLILFSLDKQIYTPSVIQFNLIKSTKYYISVLIIPMILVGATITFNRIPFKDAVSNATGSSCPKNYFSMRKETISFANVENVKKFYAFSWSSLIDDLPRGYLIQGIAIIDSEPIALTGYFPSEEELKEKDLENSCFQIENNSLNIAGLEDLNFILLSLTSSQLQ